MTDDEFSQILQEAEANGITHSMMMEERAVEEGWCLNQYKKLLTLRESLNEKARLIENQPVDKWPSFEINWDLSAINFRFAFDGLSPNEYSENYPNGLSLGWVNQSEFHSKLCHFNKRAPEELWELGFSDKLAYVIAYCAESEPLTPVIAKPHSSFENEVFLSGGNHRYAMINALNIKNMPLLVEIEDRDIMSKLFPSLRFL